ELYQPAHALNTAVLALAVSEVLGFTPEDQRQCGIAALLHDVGMARLPAETLAATKFSSLDRARVRGHPLEGARLLLRQSDVLEAAAVVSYEHHLRQDGNGYPRLSYPREPFPLSRVVAVCDAFDALLAPRPDRPGMDTLGALRQIERSAVAQFDARVVGAFSEVIVSAAADGRLLLTSRVN
ncbi:MAG TPA: HD domain-containing phosphohydrolase, partial [Gemmatimonadales bacterium]|nr:HD domain-containing phosphohydrolase [Gemmatimonadales bacterium]